MAAHGASQIMYGGERSGADSRRIDTAATAGKPISRGSRRDARYHTADIPTTAAQSNSALAHPGATPSRPESLMLTKPPRPKAHRTEPIKLSYSHPGV
jgi:hypothetical protein